MLRLSSKARLVKQRQRVRVTLEAVRPLGKHGGRSSDEEPRALQCRFELRRRERRRRDGGDGGGAARRRAPRNRQRRRRLLATKRKGLADDEHRLRRVGAQLQPVDRAFGTHCGEDEREARASSVVVPEHARVCVTENCAGIVPRRAAYVSASAST